MSDSPTFRSKAHWHSNLLISVCTFLITLLLPTSQDAQEQQRRPGIVATTVTQRSRTAATPHLNYYGGRVISNVKIVMVRYGTGTYLGNIAGTATPTMQQFYQQIVNHPHLDWLCEYQTYIRDINGNPGTNQGIGRGLFLVNTQITPATARNGSTITEQNVRDELTAQFDANTLPRPDNNTMYMIHFPQGKVLTSGALISCTNFCAYHNFYSYNGQSVYYGVHPDLATGGCQNGCGGDTTFQNQTSTASHELVEAITDPEPRSGWDDPDPVNDEIGDICNAQHATITGGDGNAYVVQKEWSNAANACIATRGGTPNDPLVCFYVDGVAGNDANSGAQDKPFRTIRATQNLLFNYVDVFIRPGNYPEQPRPVQFGKRVTLLNWGAGVVRIGTP